MNFIRIEDLDPNELYKVCQITIDGKPSMYFVKDGHGVHHKEILMGVLTLNELPHTVVKVLGDEGITYRGQRFMVDGMGGAKVLRKNVVMLFGNSLDFDMSISSAHAEKFAKENPEWQFKISPPPKESLAS